MQPRRRGSFLVLALIACVLGACAVAMAISGQSSVTRTAFSGAVAARTAAELCDSALAECVAELPGLVSGPPGSDARAGLKSHAVNGRVTGADIAGRASFTYEPERTRKLAKQDGLACDVGAVTVTPLWYAVGENRGELELTAHCTAHPGRGRALRRSVHAFHAFSLQADARTFDAWPTPTRRSVDREGDHE